MGKLQGLFLAGVAAVLLPGAARAADIEPAPEHDWTGFYIGAYGGVAWADADIEDSLDNVTDGTPGPAYNGRVLGGFAAMRDYSFSEAEGTYGVQVGYNVQLDSLVLGVQADFGALDFDESDDRAGASLDDNIPMSSEASFETQWMATLRGRLGFLPLENLLIYGTGGLAVTEVRLQHVFLYDGDVARISEVDTRWSWTAGAGMEWALSERWSLGAEYLYADFGSFSGSARVLSSLNGILDSQTEAELDLIIQTARVYLNFKL